MKTAVIALTAGGRALAEKVAAGLADCTLCLPKAGIVAEIGRLWREYDGLICIMAAGIVVRSIAPLCRDKRHDPCVVVLDECGRFAISLLSGHLGGGNALAGDVARITGGQAVITTASDVTGHTALDLWIRSNDLEAANPERIPACSARLVNTGHLAVFAEEAVQGPWPADFFPVEKIDQADIILSHLKPERYHGLRLVAKNLFIGFGCNRGTTTAEFQSALDELCATHHIDRRAIAGIASIDVKDDEEGLLEFARRSHLPMRFFSKDELNRVAGVARSDAAMKATGAKGVAEPAAVLAASSAYGPGRLFIRKMKWKNVTAAAAVRAITLRE